MLLVDLSAASAFGQARLPLPMIEVEACSISFVGEAINQGRWGGRIAIYDASVDDTGRVTVLTRRIIEKAEHLVRWVRLDQLENCLKQWRFAEPGDYEVSLRGGTIFGPVWLIDVTRGGRGLLLRVPYRYGAPTG